jgi:hypothetical protein
MSEPRKGRWWRAIRREVRKNVFANLIAGTAVIVSIFTLVYSCESNATANRIAQQGLQNSAEANRIAQRGLDIATDASRKVEAVTPDGRILGPDTRLSAAVCFRFFGYQYNIPGNARLWIALQALDDPSIYLFEVNPANVASPQESESAMAARSGAAVWITAVQIGDPRRAEDAKKYYASLYYANTAQSVDLREMLGGAARSLPPEVEAQRLGPRVTYDHSAHGAGLSGDCTLNNAANG